MNHCGGHSFLQTLAPSSSSFLIYVHLLIFDLLQDERTQFCANCRSAVEMIADMETGEEMQPVAAYGAAGQVLVEIELMRSTERKASLRAVLVIVSSTTPTCVISSCSVHRVCMKNKQKTD